MQNQPEFQSPSIDSFRSFRKKIYTLKYAFTADMEIENDSLTIHDCWLVAIHLRLHQRKAYYKFFHSKDEKITSMSQLKGIALVCYWLIRYKPLSVNEETVKHLCLKEYCTINEKFALFLIKTFVLQRIKNYEKLLAFFNAKNNEFLLYNLAHRDLSKEAFILYVTSLVGAIEL